MYKQTVLAAVAFGLTSADDCSKYPVFCDEMKNWQGLDWKKNDGYTWSAYEATGDDGYITPLFRLKAEAVNPTRGQLFVMHGTFGDATSWVRPNDSIADRYNFQPFVLQLADRGYDVWLGNMRDSNFGSHVSMVESDPKYYDYTWQDKALNDLPAGIKVIREKVLSEGGDPVVQYIGWSQATTQMLYALTKDLEEDFFADNLAAFVALAPCTWVFPGDNEDPPTYEAFLETDYELDEKFPLLLGDDFDVDDFCDEASEANCTSMRVMQHMKMIKPMNFKSLNHYDQCYIENRFQDYSSNYDKPEGRQTELADLTKIDKVPLFFISAEADGLCHYGSALKEWADTIPSLKRHEVMGDKWSHSNFDQPDTTKKQGDKFFDTLLSMLNENAIPAAIDAEDQGFSWGSGATTVLTAATATVVTLAQLF